MPWLLPQQVMLMLCFLLHLLLLCLQTGPLCGQMILGPVLVIVLLAAAVMLYHSHLHERLLGVAACIRGECGLCIHGMHATTEMAVFCLAATDLYCMRLEDAGVSDKHQAGWPLLASMIGCGGDVVH